jgi:hypothetical protein
MSYIASITARLGLDPTAFERGLARANKAVGGLAKVGAAMQFGAAAGVGALGALFTSVMQRARDSEGALDKNTAAVKRYAQAWDDLKKGAVEAGTAMLGSLNRAGEATGNALNRFFRGETREDQADADRSGAAAVERERALAALRAANSPEKVAAAQAALAAAQAKADYEAMDRAEKIAHMGARIWELDQQIADAKFRGADMAALQLEQFEAQLTVDKLRAETSKQEGEARKKAMDELAAAQKKLAEAEADYAYDQLSNSQQLAALQSEILRIDQAINQEGATALQRTELMIQRTETLRRLDAARARVAAEQQTKLQQTLETQNKLFDAAKNLQDRTQDRAGAGSAFGIANRDRVAPTLGELAEEGSQRGTASERSRARRIDRKEAEARRRFDRGDEAGAAKALGAADGLRKGLEGRIQSSEVDPLAGVREVFTESNKLLEDANATLEAIKEEIAG